MLVGEAFGEREEQAGEPFVGASGDLLNSMLHEAGIMRSECYVTNVVNARPPYNDLSKWIAGKKKDITAEHKLVRDRYVLPIVEEGIARLYREIALVQPNLIVALGNTPLWVLTGATGIMKWRGSMLRVSGEPSAMPPKLIPTIHPAAVLRQWDLRAIVVRDLRRAAAERGSLTYANEPKWNFIIRPSLAHVVDTLNQLRERLTAPEPLWLDFDLETRAGHIACAGLSWSTRDAICIPFMCVESQEGYWSLDEEAYIVHRLYLLLCHSNVRVRWQNGLYDAQYTYRHWHFVPRGAQDTMISQHTAFVALPKSLAFQASLYSPHYVYWKDDGKTWHQAQSEDQLWAYNCVDCVRTREVGEVEAATIQTLGLQSVEDFQQSLFWPVLRAMQLGVRVDLKRRDQLAAEVQEEIYKRENFLVQVLGHPVNINSSKQMCELFYTDLGQPPNMTRAKKGVPGHLTCDDEALQKIKAREPILAPIVNAIADLRTLGVFLSTFILAKLDADGRMRCSFNIAGNAKVDKTGQQDIVEKSAPYTYRLSSGQNAFGGGANMQNIPSEKSKSIGKAKARGMTFALPNIRGMYVPDPGFTFFDTDLDRADLQVVVREADDAELKAALRLGVDIHLLNVYALDGQSPPPLDELVETHPRYPDHRGPRKHKREFAKIFCHATNYGGGARTVAVHTGRSVAEVERAQRMWFGAHPGIARWHERTLEQISRRRFVENRFGYRWHIFDRVEGALPEALAWIPQSTVGCLINRIWMNIHNTIPEVQVLVQVHDSLAGQFPTHLRSTIVPRIQEASRVVIPYDDPLVIPSGISTSEISWGDC